MANKAITGTLHYLDDEDADLVKAWGAGNFLAVKFVADDWTKYTSVKVGLNPSVAGGLVEVLNDPDKDGAFKITDKDTQKFVVVATDGTTTTTETYDLKGLVCESA